MIALKTELARRLIDRDAATAQVRAEISDAEQITRRALEEVRQAVSGYRAQSVTEELAASAGCAAGRRASRRRLSVGASRLPSDLEQLFAWVVREAATNIVRHSGAASRRVRTERRATMLSVLRFVTMALGWQTEHCLEAGDRGAASRACASVSLAAGGSLAAETRPEGGCRVLAVVPLRFGVSQPLASARGPEEAVQAVIRILLAEDQDMVRGALAALSAWRTTWRSWRRSTAGMRSLKAARRQCQPDVALLDIEMPGIDGLEAAAALHVAVPACTILILTTFGRPGYLARALQAGASGFLVKDAPADELAWPIRRALAGARVVDPGLAASALAARDRTRSPSASAMCCEQRPRVRRSPRSPPLCFFPRARFATISPLRSPRRELVTAWRPRSWRPREGGSSRLLK